MILLLGTACERTARQQTESILVEDMLGRKVSIPQEINKVVGIRAGALRLLVYMNVTDKIAGLEEGDIKWQRPYTTAHPELSTLPSIGPLMGGDAEMIMNVRPDVIFTAYTTVGEADDLQKKTGIPVIALECPEVGIAAERDTLYASLRLIGKVVHKEERADSLITYMNTLIHDLDKRTLTAKNERPSVYIGGVAYSGMKDIASTQPNYPPFLFTHADNIASTIDKRLVSHVKGTYIDKEQLIVWNPDILFFDESGLSLVYANLKPGSILYKNLKAVQNNNMYTVLPYNNYAINYELIFINSWYIGKILYPEVFSDVNMEEKSNEILKMFLGKPVFRELVTSNSFRQISKDEIK
jgi:iron complex transport system substrate-binding protein